MYLGTMQTELAVLFSRPERSILFGETLDHDMNSREGLLLAQLNPHLESSKDLEDQPERTSNKLY